MHINTQYSQALHHTVHARTHQTAQHTHTYTTLHHTSPHRSSTHHTHTPTLARTRVLEPGVVWQTSFASNHTKLHNAYNTQHTHARSFNPPSPTPPKPHPVVTTTTVFGSDRGVGLDVTSISISRHIGLWNWNWPNGAPPVVLACLFIFAAGYTNIFSVQPPHLPPPLIPVSFDSFMYLFV